MLCFEARGAGVEGAAVARAQRMAPPAAAERRMVGGLASEMILPAMKKQTLSQKLGWEWRAFLPYKLGPGR
jgi:hypothetical protein